MRSWCATGALQALQEYVSGGGQLFTIGKAATFDEKGQPRVQPAFLRTDAGKGKSTYFEKLPPIDELAQALTAADRQPNGERRGAAGRPLQRC